MDNFSQFKCEQEENYRAWYDYSKLEDKDLIFILSLCFVWGLKSVIKALRFHGLPPQGVVQSGTQNY